MSRAVESATFPNHPEILGQIAGYWFRRGEPIPRAPVGVPTGAVLPRIGSDIATENKLWCLDLVMVERHWLPLSILGRYTYHHSTGLAHDEQWWFVPVPESVQGKWPVKFAVGYGDPLDPGNVESLYGPDVAQRARQDTQTVQLMLTRYIPVAISDKNRVGPNESDKDRAARELIEWHYEVEPNLELVYRVIADNEDEPNEPIKLVEVNSAAVATSRFSAFAFAPTRDFPYATTIAEITREELDTLREEGALPPGWNVDDAIEYRRPEDP